MKPNLYLFKRLHGRWCKVDIDDKEDQLKLRSVHYSLIAINVVVE